MFGISDFGAFVLAFIVLLFIPGPGNLAIITSTTKGGILGGLAATLGLMLGDQVLLWLVWLRCSWPPQPLSTRCSGWARAIWRGWVCGC